MAGWLMMAGCEDRRPVAGQGTDVEGIGSRADVMAADVTARSPAEVAELLHHYHQARDYGRIGRLIVSDRRAEAIGFIRGVDAVLENQSRLREAATRRYGAILADAWDLSAMEDNLGVFSSRCRIISQSFKGDHAIVTLQEGDHVPLVHAEFVRTAAGWRYRPDAIPEALSGALGHLAAVLDGVTDSIEAGAGFDAYVEAFGREVLPQMGRVVAVGGGENSE